MDKNSPLEASVRIRRTLLLATHCISNIAGYRAGWDDTSQALKIPRDFWIRLNGNFLDVATLEWCKLFSDKRSFYHWSKTFKSKSAWKESLSKEIKIPLNQIKEHVKSIARYRNKYVAHLDPPDEIVYHPRTEFMLSTVSFLYDQIRISPDTRVFVSDISRTAEELYQRRFTQAFDEYNFVATSRSAFINSREIFRGKDVHDARAE